MGLVELLLLSVGLAMDAFSAAVCRGLGMNRNDRAGALLTALFFGGFQAGMPLAGYFIGSRFSGYIESADHWAAFGLLVLIGGKMIYESFTDGTEAEYRPDIRELLMLSVATSIDALAVGVIFAAARVNIAVSVSIIGAVTFVLSLAGVLTGQRFGSRYEKKAETAGGIILILIGIKLLLEGLGVL